MTQIQLKALTFRSRKASKITRNKKSYLTSVIQ